MNRCRRCNDATHLDFPTGREACNGCDRAPAWCRCQPVAAAFVPEWKRRANSKDLTGAVA